MDHAAGQQADHLSAEEHAAQAVDLLRQAQDELRGDASENKRTQALFEKLVGYLDVAVQALESFRGQDPRPKRMVH